MSGESAHILIVDDDARLRALLSRFLTENGFRVTMAETAAEARDKLRFMDFDLLVLDVMMPGETGLSLTGDLRSERAPTLPILLLTARGAPEDIVAGFEAGADDYLGKPFDPRVLLARIRAMLRRAQPASLVQTGPLQLGPRRLRRRPRRAGRAGQPRPPDRRQNLAARGAGGAAGAKEGSASLFARRCIW